MQIVRFIAAVLVPRLAGVTADRDDSPQWGNSLTFTPLERVASGFSRKINAGGSLPPKAEAI
jgi:hypothetical protein